MFLLRAANLTGLYLKVTLILTLVNVGLNTAAHTLGRVQPPNPALAGFSRGCEDKPQPCWYGIVPGETRLETAQILIRQLGYQYDSEGFCNNSDSEIYRIDSASIDSINLCASGGIVRNLRLAPTGQLDINLGELLMIWGEPDFIEFTSRRGNVRLSNTSLRLNYPRAEIFISLFWERNATGSSMWVDERSDIRSIDLLSTQPITEAMRARRFTRWSGLLPLWCYCRLNSEFAPCFFLD